MAAVYSLIGLIAGLVTVYIVATAVVSYVSGRGR